MGQQRRFILFIVLWYAVVITASAQEGEFYGAKETDYPAWFKESFLELSADVAEAAQEQKRVLLLFHQDGCPYCNRLVEHNLAQKDIKQQMQANLDVIAVNMWGDRAVVDLDGVELTEKEFAAKLRIQFTPTLLFLDEQGKVILRLNGYIPPAQFKTALDYVTGHHETRSSYRDYFAKNRPQSSAKTLHKELFYSLPPYDLSQGDRPIAVYFEQSPCPNCDILHQVVLKDRSVFTPASRFESIQLDMWSNTPLITPEGEATTAKAWAKALGISFAPTVVLFDREQGEVIRSEALFKRFHTASLFDYVLTGAFRKEPSFQRFLSARADRIRATGEDVDIWR